MCTINVLYFLFNKPQMEQTLEIQISFCLIQKRRDGATSGQSLTFVKPP